MPKHNVIPGTDPEMDLFYSSRNGVEYDVRMWEREGYMEFVEPHRTMIQVANRNGRVLPKHIDY
jgi:hypothetical protein